MFSVSNRLIEKYSVIGPRYTSYPTAPMWVEINESEHDRWLLSENNSQRPLALYIHIPFCRKRCLYCGCNVLVTKQQWQSAQYVEYLIKELDHLAERQEKGNAIRQLHFGGGTPNFLLDKEFELILAKIHSLFSFEENAEIGIEIDPCSTRPDQLRFLSTLGFNRLSLGVQDLDENVQKAVRRSQSREITLEHLTQARALSFKGINFDLIYGLPLQTSSRFSKTVDTVIGMRPDRLAVYNFGYLPNRMPHQRKIDPAALPDDKTKITILLDTISRLTRAGYNYIGMDHFALPDDELSIAQKNRTLHRNFMGYTPKSGVNLFGIGASAISEFGPYFVQNEKSVKRYKEKIGANGFAGVRGVKLNADDQVRKWTIIRLASHFFISFAEFEAEFQVRFQDYFKSEIERLKPMEQDGLLMIGPNSLEVVNHGKILVRNICMLFDVYLRKKDVPSVRFSKTI